MTGQEPGLFRIVPERTRHAAGTWWRGPGGHTALWCIVMALLGAYVWSSWPSHGPVLGAPWHVLARTLTLLAVFFTALVFALRRLERRNGERHR